jgi:hypothetical protein
VVVGAEFVVGAISSVGVSVGEGSGVGVVVGVAAGAVIFSITWAGVLSAISAPLLQEAITKTKRNGSAVCRIWVRILPALIDRILLG